MIKIIKIQCSFYVRVCVCRKYSYGQFNKNDLFARVCVYMVKKSIESMCQYLAEVKRIKIDFTYIHVFVYIYV